MSSSESDRERHWRLLGGAVGARQVAVVVCSAVVDVVVMGVVTPLLLRLRSLIRLVIAEALPGSLAQGQPPGPGIGPHRLPRLAPGWQGALRWTAQDCPRSSHLSASAIFKGQIGAQWELFLYVSILVVTQSQTFSMLTSAR